MRRLQTAGIVLLFVSLLTNAVLILRGTGRTASDRPTAPGPQEQTQVLSQLASERERNVVLGARIRELETTLETARRTGPAASPREEKASLFRDRLRRYIRVVANDFAYVDPEVSLTISEVSTDFFRASVRRAKDPATYADCLKELFDAALGDGKLKLAGDQPKELQRILEEYRDSLVRVPPDSVALRGFRDLEIESSAMARARTLLDEAQYARLRETLTGVGVFVQPPGIHGLESQGAEELIVQRWAEAYQLDETQRSTAMAAARSFAETLRRVGLQHPADLLDNSSGTEGNYDSRVRSLQAQLTALKLLEDGMTPAQKERFHSRALMEFFIQPTGEDQK